MKPAKRREKTNKPRKSDTGLLTGRKLPAIKSASDTTGATGAVTTDRKGGAAILPVSAAPLSLVIPTPPSLNEMFGNNSKGGKGRFPKKIYKDWIGAALWNIARQQPHRFDVRCVVFAAVQRRSLSADIDNRSKPILDILKSAGIYKDDSRVTAIAFVWSLYETRLLIVPATQAIRARFTPTDGSGEYGGWYFDRSEED